MNIKEQKEQKKETFLWRYVDKNFSFSKNYSGDSKLLS